MAEYEQMNNGTSFGFGSKPPENPNSNTIKPIHKPNPTTIAPTNYEHNIASKDSNKNNDLRYFNP